MRRKKIFLIPDPVSFPFPRVLVESIEVSSLEPVIHRSSGAEREV